MNETGKAFIGCEIFDGSQRHFNCALLVKGRRIQGIVANDNIPGNYEQTTLPPGLITSGFVDLQVNGGGGVLLNDDPTIEALKIISQTHLKYGTTSLLPTMITDHPDKIESVLTATQEAIALGVNSVLGLHLEGPHLAMSRKGVHNAEFIRRMQNKDLKVLLEGAKYLPSLMITLATENATPQQISTLSHAGAILSLGHTDTNYEDASSAVKQGVSCVTHLFNAMSPLTSRAPGLVGAALELGALSAGLIADGYHVDIATIKIALRAKNGPGKIFLVTDAMSTVGTDLTQLQIDNRLIKRENGRLTLEDGTLAGADLDMLSAVNVMINEVNLCEDEALRMASLYPAMLLKREKEIGQLIPGALANFLHLDQNFNLSCVWQDGIIEYYNERDNN